MTEPWRPIALRSGAGGRAGAELIVRGGRGASANPEPIDVAVDGGLIAAVGPSLDLNGRTEIDASGLLVLPGGFDPHVHFNEPGPRTAWEGFASGSRAAAAGGLTAVAEMPLNASPPTIDTASLDAKLAAAQRASVVDFALWGGVVPGNRAELEPLARRGVIGFKAFMSATGVEDFASSDDLTLLEAMRTLAELGLPLAVHAENDTITAALAARARREGRRAVRDYLRSRPPVAETEAVSRAIELAAATGCALHIVHISTGRGVALVSQARDQGVDVTCEVTPHHLILAEADAEALGALAKCAPPLREPAEGEALWRGLAGGEISFVASDHSPAPPELKAGDDAFATWGGISGVQSTLELLLSEGSQASRLPVERVADVWAENAASRLRLAGKGSLQVGRDGDLALVELGSARPLSAGELLYRHPHSPFLGRSLSARVRCTVLRGKVVYRDGEIVGPPRGRLLTPQKPSR